MLEKNRSKFAFGQINSKPTEFYIYSNSIEFSGNLYLKDLKIFCEGQIKGLINHFCDSCFKPIEIKMNEKVSLILTNGICKNSDNLDIFEFFNGFIDINEILESEVEAFKSDYFYCDNCKNL